MTDSWRPGILGTTGSFGSIQYTDGNVSGSQIEILDSSRNLKNIQNLNVTGAADFDSTVNVDGQTTLASAAVSDLTSGRIVLAGTSGELEDSANLTFNGSKLSVDGIVSGSGQLQGASVAVDGDVSAANGSFSGNLTVSGDLTINGTTTTVNTTNLDVTDNMVLLNDGVGANANTNDSGILIERGSTGDNAFMGWDESADKFILGTTTAGSTDTGDLSIDAARLVVSDLEGNVTGNVDGQVSDISNHDTGDLAEGSNLYYTDARARDAVSATDAGGDGSFAYNSSTGVFTYTGPSASETRAHFSAADFITLTDGAISVNATEFTSSARSAVSVTDNGGDGSLSYDSSTGVISYTGPSASEVRAHLSSGYMIDYASGEFAINATQFSASWDDALSTKDTGDLAEGSNLYYTDARARAAVSVTDAGGDGSLAYNSSTGVITYTGPSASEVRAHFSAGSNIGISSGVISLSSSLVDMTSISASSFVSASSFEVDGNASISYDTSALDFSTGGAGAKLSTTMFSASVELQGPSMEVSGAAKAGSLYLGASGSTVSVILDEDDMASDSATALATQQSIKAYVDAQLTAQDVDFAGDSGTGSVDLDTQSLTIAGTTNEIETSASGQTLTIGLPNDVTIGNDLTVTRNLAVNGNVDLGNGAEDSITVNGLFDSHLLPDGATRDIGSNDNRWGDVYATNVYTGDFHMKNERGDWTLFEESDHIRIRNNATGQEFKLDMTPVEE